jgi:hypothetical protein
MAIRTGLRFALCSQRALRCTSNPQLVSFCMSNKTRAQLFRSPWSNKYEPPLPDGAVPSPQLRETEVKMNDVMDIYRDLYYEGGISSVYCWDVQGGFAAVILFKKSELRTRTRIRTRIRIRIRTYTRDRTCAKS